MLAFFCKAGKQYINQPSSAYTILLHTFFFIYFNHVWGKNYHSCLDRISLIQKKLIRIITCSPFRAHTEPCPYILQIKFRTFVISMTTSLVLSCMATFLIYSEDIFREMLMYMTISFEMQMIYTYHMDDLISENSVSKLQERICGILFHPLLKTRNQFILRKIWALLNWEN